MGTHLKIKICGMREPHNFKEIDALNPDYIGIIFYHPSPRNMDKNPDAIPETKAHKVGVFVDAAVETIIKKAREFKLHTIQLHGSESPEFCSQLTGLGYQVFKAIKVDKHTAASEIEPYKGHCTALLLDTKSEKQGGSGVKFNWNKLDELAHSEKFFLSGGISETDIEAVLNLNYPNLIGLDLNSRFEIEPGLKDASRLQKFINTIKTYTVA